MVALVFQVGDAKSKLWWWKLWLSSLGLSKRRRGEVVTLAIENGLANWPWLQAGEEPERVEEGQA